MQVNSINAMGCQPLKTNVNAVPLRNANVAFKQASDSFEHSSDSKDVLEAKYDFACRLAAYYEKAYNELLQKKSCKA